MSAVRSKLSKEIRDWARDRGIIEHTSIKNEFNRIVVGLGKDENLLIGLVVGVQFHIKQFIGETYMSLTCMLATEGINIEELEPTQNEFYEDSKNRENAIYWVINSIGDMAKYIARNKKDKLIYKIKDLLDDLSALAIYHETNLDECIKETFEEIKDIQGEVK